MQTTVLKFIPSEAHDLVNDLLTVDHLVIKVKSERKTRHGDYRELPNGKHQITVNSNLNPYRFLITLIHEIAHFEAYRTFGRFIKPHGKEWKQTFQHLMLPFLRPEIFPSELLPLLAKHFKNPKASSDTDTQLALALKQFNETNDKTYVFEVPLGRHLNYTTAEYLKEEKKEENVLNVLRLKQVNYICLILMQK